MRRCAGTLVAGARLVVVLMLVAPAAPLFAEEPEVTPPKVARRGANDKRRTVRNYGTNLLHNVTGVLSRGNRETFLYTAVFTVPARSWDADVVRYFQQHPHGRFGDIGRALGGSLAVGGLTVGAFAAGRVARGDRMRAASYDVGQAVIVTQLYTQVLKQIARRERPNGTNRQSFPSGHSSNAFAVAGVLGHHYGLKLEVPALGLASFIAISRCAAGVHHFSDVFAGAGLGWGMGRAVSRRNGRPPGSPSTDASRFQMTLGPDAGPSGDGRGLSLHVTF